MHLILYDIGATGTIPEHWEKKLLRKNTTIYAFDKNKISIQNLSGVLRKLRSTIL